jgi:hypothetical protein
MLEIDLFPELGCVVAMHVPISCFAGGDVLMPTQSRIQLLFYFLRGVSFFFFFAPSSSPPA